VRTKYRRSYCRSFFSITVRIGELLSWLLYKFGVAFVEWLYILSASRRECPRLLSLPISSATERPRLYTTGSTFSIIGFLRPMASCPKHRRRRAGQKRDRVVRCCNALLPLNSFFSVNQINKSLKSDLQERASSGIGAGATQEWMEARNSRSPRLFILDRSNARESRCTSSI
jgi:hypothetical protein